MRDTDDMYIYIGGWGGESACDPNREIDFGFVFVYVSCVRAKLCARILRYLGTAKLIPSPASPAAAGTQRSSDILVDVPQDIAQDVTDVPRDIARDVERRVACGVSRDVLRDVPCEKNPPAALRCDTDVILL